MPLDVEIRFELQTQELQNWCWASVTSGVHDYLNAERKIRQCEVASLLLGQDCCGNPTQFDFPETLDGPLSKVLNGSEWDLEVVAGPLKFAEIEREIEAGRPIGTHITWAAGQGAHFNVIYGYRETVDGRQQVYVSDPFFIDSLVDLTEFTNAYQREGTWDSTVIFKQRGGA